MSILWRRMAGAILLLSAVTAGPAVAQSSMAPDRTRQDTDGSQGELPAWRHTSVNDLAGVLTASDARTLDEALIALNGSTGVEGTVVTLTDRTRYGGGGGANGGTDSESLERFATRLFNHWGVGDADRNDGFMVLLLPRAREARIELGQGYPREADILAQDIMSRVMLPDFRQGDFSRGLREGTLAVIDRIARPHAEGRAVAAPRDRGGQSARAFGLFALGAGGIFALAAWDRRRRDRCPQCGTRGLTTVSAPIREDLPAGGWRTGKQTRTRRCPACGWEKVAVVPLSVITDYDHDGRRQRVVRNPDRPGGSTGFGGGSSSGGGASGRW